MAAIPTCGLKCRTKKMYEYLKVNKRQIIIYSIFYILGIECVSYFIRSNANYACYWYPLLTQIGYCLILFSLFLWHDKLRFCFRKQLATLFLTAYYLFGCISLIFQFSDRLYSSVISIGLLSISILTFILSIFKKE